jgi:ATP-dependent DNA ligase
MDLDCEAVLDGEVAALDSEGRPQFYDLLRRGGQCDPVLYVFDLFSDAGEGRARHRSVGEG